MKCEKARILMLLEQSGELSDLKRRRLAEHLAVCPACALHRDEISRITKMAGEQLPAQGPSESVIHKILSSAPAPEISQTITFPWIAARIVALAAAVVAIVGGVLLFMPEYPRSSPGPEHSLSAIMAIVDEEPPDQYHSPNPSNPREIERELGRHLLRIEGLLDDDLLAAALL